MKITADTNILVRALTEDDLEQSPLAQRLLRDATLVAIPVLVLCELYWVLARAYNHDRATIVAAIRMIVSAANVATDPLAVAAGIAMAEAGGDFADGVIAYQGQWLGGETFVSFDAKAVRRLVTAGQEAMRLA